MPEVDTVYILVSWSWKITQNNNNNNIKIPNIYFFWHNDKIQTSISRRNKAWLEDYKHFNQPYCTTLVFHFWNFVTFGRKGKEINHIALHQYFISEILWRLEEKEKKAAQWIILHLLTGTEKNTWHEMIFSVNLIYSYLCQSTYSGTQTCLNQWR